MYIMHIVPIKVHEPNKEESLVDQLQTRQRRKENIARPLLLALWEENEEPQGGSEHWSITHVSAGVSPNWGICKT